MSGAGESLKGRVQGAAGRAGDASGLRRRAVRRNAGGALHDGGGAHNSEMIMCNLLNYPHFTRDII